MKKRILLVGSLLTLSVAQGEMFFLGENSSGVEPYYSIGLQYLDKGTFVGAGTAGKPRPREYAYERMFYKNGEELVLDDSIDMVYEELPEQCLVHEEDETVFVYFDVRNNLDLDVTKVTVPSTGDAGTYYAHNIQLPAHPVVTVGSFIPRFPEDGEWIANISYRSLSDEGVTLLGENFQSVPEYGFNLESTVRHYNDSELNVEQTIHTPNAFIDYGQTMLRAIGGFHSHFGETKVGGVVVWNSEAILGMTDLQPYAWWIEVMTERRILPTDLAIEILQDPNKAQLACDPNNYVARTINLGPNSDSSSIAPNSGGGSLGFGLLYLFALLKLIVNLGKRGFHLYTVVFYNQKSTKA